MFRTCWPVLCTILIFGFLPGQVACYNVLIMSPFGSHGHKHVFDAIAIGLSQKGHKVTHISSVPGSIGVDGVVDVYLDAFSRVYKDLSFFIGNMNDPAFMEYLLNGLMKLLREIYTSPEVREIIHRSQDNASRYDVMLLDGTMTEGALPIAHHVGIPVMVVSTTMLYHHTTWGLDIPLPFATIPAYFTMTTGPMNFWQRLSNTYENLKTLNLRSMYAFPALEAVIREYLPNAPPLLELEKNISFALCNSHPSFYPKFPTMPYVAEIGGVHCRPGKKLPKDLDDFINGSGDAGAIFFSLGSVTKAMLTPKEMTEKVLETFSRLQQRVLWKYEEKLPNLPPNVKIVKWAPQQDILAHPKLRLFITHAGGLSLQESIYHGRPILGFPLSADQWGNIGHAIRNGIGDYLDWKTFTADEMYNKIQKLITDPSYSENVQRVSTLWKDRPMKAIDTATYWVEYVIRHKGAAHLKGDAGRLNIFQYLLLDIVALVSLVVIAIVIATYLVAKFAYKLLCGPSKGTKAKRN